MEYYFFVIIVIIVLKILFWTFYFYVRAQRLRQASTARHFIIVGTRPVARGQSHLYNDRSAIINHAEPVCAMGPPPYAEVVKDSNGPLPPSYDQAVSSSRAADGPVSSSNAHMPTPTGSTLAGEVYSPPSEYPQQFVGHPASLSSVNEAPNSSAPVQ